MKRTCLLMIFCLMAVTQLFAQSELTADQQKLRSDIFSFLKVEGYVPTIDEDGDIMFKKGGTTYFVSITPNEIDPMYVRVVSFYAYNSDLTKSKVEAALPDLNLWRTVRVICEDSNFYLQSDMFLKSADAFKDAFGRIMEIFPLVELELSEL